MGNPRSHRVPFPAAVLALGVAVPIPLTGCGTKALTAGSSPALTPATSARPALSTTAAETSTTAAPSSTPSTTVVGNTLLRYWGPITGPYNGEGLHLVPPASGVTPRVTWQDAARPCSRSTGTNNCAAQTIPEDVFLAVGTDTNSGQIGPGGSITPALDNTLIYVIAETFSCASPPGGASGPGTTTPTTTTPRVYSCVLFDFVDADTGRGLLGMEGPQLTLPPHA
jgi:hypothetical protein